MEHSLYMLAVKRSNEPQRISWEGKIGEVRNGELLVGVEKLTSVHYNKDHKT